MPSFLSSGSTSVVLIPKLRMCDCNSVIFFLSGVRSSSELTTMTKRSAPVCASQRSRNGTDSSRRLRSVDMPNNIFEASTNSLSERAETSNDKGGMQCSKIGSFPGSTICTFGNSGPRILVTEGRCTPGCDLTLISRRAYWIGNLTSRSLRRPNLCRHGSCRSSP